MANVKQVHIDARVPFDWASNLSPREAQVWAAWVLGPSSGLELYHVSDGYEPVPETGGQCSMYRLMLDGQEAIRDGALAILADSLRKQRFAEVEAVSRDLEYSEDEPFYTVPTVRQSKAAERRAHKQVEEMMRGHHWETTDHGNGISESRLVPDEEAA